MIAKLRPRLTYTNVMATRAMFVALGGGAFAAIGEFAIAWNRQGRRGLQGEQGLQGQGVPGPPGPTFGAIGHGQAADPSPSPDEGLHGPASGPRHFAFTLPASTQPVPTSQQPGEVNAIVSTGAGSHVAEVREDCASGDTASGSDSGRTTWTVLLLGG
jgi:hypothetical protein